MATTPASVSALLKPKANVGRNAFPLDHRQVYSIKSGQITPVKAMHFVPNDHFEVKVDEFCITFPMQTAPFLRGRKETVFYQVYYSAIWSLYNQYIGQRSDPKTSALDTRLVEPRISLFDLYKDVFFQFLSLVYHDIIIPAQVRHTQVNGNVSEDVMQDLILQRQVAWLAETFVTGGAGSSRYFSPQGATPQIGVFAFDRTNGRHTNFPWSTGYGIKNFPGKTTALMRDWCQDVVGQFRCFNHARKLDMLGYGNLLPYLKECYNTMNVWLSEITTFDTTNTNNFIADCNNICARFASKIEDMCFTYGSSYSNVTPVYQNLYAICAYNLIFYHFFRNSFYDLDYPAYNYNLDFVSVPTTPVNTFNIVKIHDFSIRFLDIEYHQWKKDQFTGVLPDTQFGAVSGLSLNVSSINTSSDINNYTQPADSSLTDSDVVTANASQGVIYGLRVNQESSSYSISHIHSVSGQTVSFDMIALKRAEILQDYRQTLMRAGNKTSDIFTALYGGAPSSEHVDDIIPRFLETFGEDVFVDPVTATANTEQGSNGTLGDLSARGKFSGSSKKFNINVGKNFGVVLVLTYFVPTSEYNSYFIDPHNSLLTPEDHYISNFENSGLEPVYSDELNSLVARNDLHVLGYAPRYHAFKSQIDVVHGEFVSLPNNMKVVQNGHAGVFNRVVPSSQGFNGEFNIWVAPRTDMQNRSATQLRDFYINPAILDNIFVQKASALQSSDHLICNTYINWQATRGMSKVGLMNFV